MSKDYVENGEKNNCENEREESKEDKERRVKIKNYLWCVEKPDKALHDFSKIASAIRKTKNKALTRSYFYPGSMVYPFDDERYKDAMVKRDAMDEYEARSLGYKPPPWFVTLTKKQVQALTKVYELLEGPQTLGTDEKLAAAIGSLDLGLGRVDVDDMKTVFEIKNFSNLEFGEFVYCLATLDRIKKIIAWNDDPEGDRSRVQSVLFTALVQFAVASCCVCNDLHIEGVDTNVRFFFDCKLVCMDRLSSCLYSKMKAQFECLPDHDCSPYYHSLRFFRQAMSACRKKNGERSPCQTSLTLIPYVYHMTTIQKNDGVIDDSVVRGVFDVYSKNGCLVTTLPDAYWIPIVRILLAKVTIFEPVCSGTKRREEIMRKLSTHKDNMNKRIQKSQEVKQMHAQRMRLLPPKLKVHLKSSCASISDFQSCFTPASYSKFTQKVKQTEHENLKSIFVAAANRNRLLRKQLELTLFPQNIDDRFAEIFDLYNPTDPRSFLFGTSNGWRSREPKELKRKDPDLFN